MSTSRQSETSYNAAKSGEIPALSRNGGLEVIRASPVACSYNAKSIPRGKGRFASGGFLPDEPSLSSITPLVIEAGGTMRSTERSTRKKLIGAVVALAFVAAACGSDAADNTSADAPTGTEAPAPTGTEAPVEAEPASTEAPADTTPAEVEEPGVPERIISLSPTHTEIMFAIGAGELLVAVDDLSLCGAEPSWEVFGRVDRASAGCRGRVSRRLADPPCRLGDQLAEHAPRLVGHGAAGLQQFAHVASAAPSKRRCWRRLTCRPVSPQRSLQHRRPKLR